MIDEKNWRGMKLIFFSNKKMLIKKYGPNLKHKQIEWMLWNFGGSGIKIEEERKKNEKKGHQHHIGGQ
jgi:hypothetical protein